MHPKLETQTDDVNSSVISRHENKPQTAIVLAMQRQRIVAVRRRWSPAERARRALLGLLNWTAPFFVEGLSV